MKSDVVQSLVTSPRLRSRWQFFLANFFFFPAISDAVEALGESKKSSQSDMLNSQTDENC